ncbi:MAG TPA: ATP-binding cassette domain-containing protein [Roseiflexaceae bacterium]|nr:ATP-binding cassette domain-containing protein [Roseiflexaceae bacterium]
MLNDTQTVLDMPMVDELATAISQRGADDRPAAKQIVDVRRLRKVFVKRKVDPEATFWSRLSGRGRPTETSVAVEDVSFGIAEGEIFGLLGPNGAGKTTTIRMLCTLLEPTGGSATINGHDIVRQAGLVRQNLGAVRTGERSIYWKLTGRENLEYFAALYHIPPVIARRRVADLLERLGLANRADELVERYSSGMKQRIAIAKALLANPPVLLLDEPTIGLDPQSARNLRELISEIKREGRTILLTTHYMEEADQLCDHVGIIDLGRIIALDTPANLKKSIKQLDVVQLEVEDFDPALTDALNRLPTVRHVISRYSDEERVWSLALHADDSRNLLPRLIELIGSSAGQIRHLAVAQPSLEDVFISLTGKQLRD